MKYFLPLFLGTISATGSFAQDAKQPSGSWYVEYSDVTNLVNPINGDALVYPSIGYTLVNNLMLHTSINGPTDYLDFNLGARYFLGDVYTGVAVTDLFDYYQGSDLSVELGTYLGFKEIWYVTPRAHVDLGAGSISVGAGIGLRL